MPKNDKIPLNRITYVEEIELDGIKYVRKDTTARMQRIKQARAGVQPSHEQAYPADKAGQH